MKKRFLPITLVAILLMTFIPFGPAALAAGEFEATLMGQLDTAVSELIGEWEFGDIPEATVSFDIGEIVTISMEFDEPIKFTGNWTGISTNVPVDDDDHAERIGAQILNFVVDGDDLGSRPVPLINRDDAGFLTIDIARQWGGDWDAYDLAGMDPFSSLEITFFVGMRATLMGQLDADVSDAVDEWGIGDIPEATVVFTLREQATISMEFDEPIKFTGNWTGISTNVPVASDEDAESTGARITAFVVDGVDLGARDVPLINRDNSGFLTIDIARQWGGDWDAYDLAGMDPFSSLEITFIVLNVGTGEAGDAEDAAVDFPAGGNAWFGGTVVFAGRTDGNEPGDNDWYEFDDQITPFEFGVPFTVTLDLGSETATHGVAVWDGYIFVVQTDVDMSAVLFDAAIESVLVDGRDVPFDPFEVEVGHDRGLRVALTSMWEDNPVVANYNAIGEFSTIEVTLAIWIYGEQENPFGELEEPTEPEPVAPPPPIERPEPPAAVEDPEGLPGWVIPVIIVAVVVIAGAVVLVVLKSKKKDAS